MTCYYPLAGFWSEGRGRWCRHAPNDAAGGYSMSVPCGQCVGCRLERARQWGVRCEHEMSLYERNCFITLTYDDLHLPENESVDVREMQLFMKRLRKRFGNGIRVLYCGEYGDDNFRPHYHAILFNFDFDDRKVFKRLRSGFTIDVSATLSSLWCDDNGVSKGFTSVGSATFESAAYVASYCLKKVTGDRAAVHYARVTRYGECVNVTPEFAHMSKGIGLKFLEKFEADIYPADQVVSRGGRVGRPPRFYAKKFVARRPANEGVYEDIQDRRRVAGEAQAWNSTPERLAVREQVLLAKLSSHGNRSL